MLQGHAVLWACSGLEQTPYALSTPAAGPDRTQPLPSLSDVHVQASVAQAGATFTAQFASARAPYCCS